MLEQISCYVAACQVPDVTFSKAPQDASAAHPGDITPGSDAAPAQSPSCVGLPATCGAIGNDDCCHSLEVQGGTYLRSYDHAGDGDSGDIGYLATVSSFRLDKYEVTVGRFRAFVNAGMGTQARPPAPGAGGHANIPASGWVAAWDAGLATDAGSLLALVKCQTTFQTWADLPGANENRPMTCLT